MTRKERLNKRNELVRQYFAELEQKHPQWRLSALMQETANHFPPLSVSTVSAILNYNGIYGSQEKENTQMPSLFDDV